MRNAMNQSVWTDEWLNESARKLELFHMKYLDTRYVLPDVWSLLIRTVFEYSDVPLIIDDYGHGDCKGTQCR